MHSYTVHLRSIHAHARSYHGSHIEAERSMLFDILKPRVKVIIIMKLSEPTRHVASVNADRAFLVWKGVMRQNASECPLCDREMTLVKHCTIVHVCIICAQH